MVQRLFGKTARVKKGSAKGAAYTRATFDEPLPTFWIGDHCHTLTGGGRVLWDRLSGTKKDNVENQCSATFMSIRGTISDKEVLATLSGLQYPNSVI